MGYDRAPGSGVPARRRRSWRSAGLPVLSAVSRLPRSFVDAQRHRASRWPTGTRDEGPDVTVHEGARTFGLPTMRRRPARCGRPHDGGAMFETLVVALDVEADGDRAL